MVDKLLYRDIQVQVSSGDQLYDYASTVTSLANNLSNAVRFRQRQALTASGKDPESWSLLEKDAMAEFAKWLPDMNRIAKANYINSKKNKNSAANSGDKSKGSFKSFAMPEKGKWFLSAGFLEYLMRCSENPDYCAAQISKQTAEHIVSSCVKDMLSFTRACKAYAKNPDAFTGKPKLPGYKRKGGHCTCVITNQDAKLEAADGMWKLKLPKVKERLSCGLAVSGAKLKEVKIVPSNGVYIFHVILSVEKTVPDTKEPDRIASIDMGVENFMAVTNNCGLPCVLYKGGTIKSINQFYNKEIAKIVSAQTKETNAKFVPTSKSMKITLRRNNCINDNLHKYAKHLINWCVGNGVDTLVIGVNQFWKQEINLGKINNQNFVQIPFFRMRNILQYLCEENGINYVEHEESYTSKASFLDNDNIPVYNGEDHNYQFSGKRRPTRYKGMYKKDGFRGLYKSKDGTIINADLNGSANILRKAFPDAFSRSDHQIPDFENVLIVRHPNFESGKTLKERQKKGKLTVNDRSDKFVVA